MIKALLGFIPGAFGLKGMAIAGGVALAIGAASGWKVRDAFCDAAAAKVELAIERSKTMRLQAELKAQKEIASFAIGAQELLLQNNIDLTKKVSDYEATLAEQKPIVACSIDDADLRFRDSLRKRAKRP